MDLTTYSLYGNQANTSAIPADMLSTNSDGSIDWGAVLAGGIRGAAQAAISASVGEKYANGQLVATSTAAAQSKRTSTLLLIAVIGYFVLKG